MARALQRSDVCFNVVNSAAPSSFNTDCSLLMSDCWSSKIIFLRPFFAISVDQLAVGLVGCRRGTGVRQSAWHGTMYMYPRVNTMGMS